MSQVRIEVHPGSRLYDLPLADADVKAENKRFRAALEAIADGKVGLTETHYQAQRRHVMTARKALSGAVQ